MLPGLFKTRADAALPEDNNFMWCSNLAYFGRWNARFWALAVLRVLVANEYTLVLTLAEVEVTEVRNAPFDSRKRSKSLANAEKVVLNCLLDKVVLNLVNVLKLKELIWWPNEAFFVLSKTLNHVFHVAASLREARLCAFVFDKTRVFALSWFVKKYFLVVQSRLSSKKSKLCKCAGVELSKLR